MLTRHYFHNTVLVADPFYKWAGATLSAGLLIAVYRAAFFYGACRWVAWTVWAHVVHAFPLDLSWGGPHWVKAVHSAQLNASARNCPCPMCRVRATDVLRLRVHHRLRPDQEAPSARRAGGEVLSLPQE